jgi:hypothetical protein
MSNLTEAYIQGAQSFNHFFSMVHHALIECMPGVELSGSGAWVWRGYRIDSYKNLAKGLFYCQIYTSDPNTLMLKESYYQPDYKPLDQLDETYKIKDGRYYHPFWSTLNLYRSRFFLLRTSEQYEIIRNFVGYAANQALTWQNSEARSRPEITSQDYLEGNNKIQLNTLHAPSSFDHVTRDYLNFLPLQKKIFSQLVEKLNIYIDNDEKWLKPNGAWRNWDFRSYRMKIVPGDHANFLWEIYYHQPEKLVANSYDGSDRTEIGYFDIADTKYFDKDPEEQSQMLDNFLQYSLERNLK